MFKIQVIIDGENKIFKEESFLYLNLIYNYNIIFIYKKDSSLKILFLLSIIT